MADQPNPISVAITVLGAMRWRRPRPAGDGSFNHARLTPVLEALAAEGVGSLPARRPHLAAHRDECESIDPDQLSRDEALAFWLNLYNAGALDLAAKAQSAGASSVLRTPGAFRETWATIAGERLSLNDIEHGKVRRFRDPRIHAALVCGSASCPTLRPEPYDGSRLEEQLDDQMRSFLAGGAASADRESGVLRLSRVFLWYGADFTRATRMPTWLPTRKRKLAAMVAKWLPADDARWVLSNSPKVEFAPYDWGLACSIA